MPLEAEIKLKIQQFTDAMRSMREYFKDLGKQATASSKEASDAMRRVGDAAKKSSESMKGGGSSDVAGTIKGLMDMFSKLKSGGFNMKNMTESMAEFTKKSSGGLNAVRGFMNIAEAMTRLAGGNFAGAMASGSRALYLLGAACGPLVIGLGAAVAILTGVGIAVAFALKGINYYTEAVARSRETGLKVSDLLPIEAAFEMVGARASNAAPALGQFFTKLTEARFGAGETAQALRELSIASGKELKPIKLLEMNNVDAFNAVIDALKTVNNEAQRIQIASKLFGSKTGLEVKAIIDTGALGSARSAMAPITSELEKQSGTIASVGQSFSLLWQIISSGTSLAFASFSRLFEPLMDMFKLFGGFEIVSSIFANIGKYISNLGSVVAPAMAVVGAFLAAILKMVDIFIEGIGMVGSMLAGMLDVLLAVGEAVAQVIKTITFGLVDTTGYYKAVKGKRGEKDSTGEQKGPVVQAFLPVQAAIAGSLTKVGGGGMAFGGGAGAVDLQREQLEMQRQIRDNTAPIKNMTMRQVSLQEGTGNDYGYGWQ
jgi:phage-related protein